MQYGKAKNFILKLQKKGFSNKLSYHSIGHVKDVFNSALRLAEEEGIKGNDLALLKTAVLFHDSGFIHGAKDHEEKSCDLAKKHLPQFGYSEEAIQTICGMIRATKVPQKPQNHLEEIICDADLDYLGRDDFFEIGEYLFSELKMYGVLASAYQWNTLQIVFLEKHTYFTKSAIESRQAKKLANLQLVKNILASQNESE